MLQTVSNGCDLLQKGREGGFLRVSRPAPFRGRVSYLQPMRSIVFFRYPFTTPRAGTASG